MKHGMTGGKVKVTVRDGWAVYDGIEQRGGSSTVEVDPETVEQCEAAGWGRPRPCQPPAE